jgi:hypothetical protein
MLPVSQKQTAVLSSARDNFGPSRFVNPFYWLNLYLSKILLQLLFLDCQLFFGLTSHLTANTDSLLVRTKDMNVRRASCNVSIIWSDLNDTSIRLTGFSSFIRINRWT